MESLRLQKIKDLEMDQVSSGKWQLLCVVSWSVCGRPDERKTHVCFFCFLARTLNLPWVHVLNWKTQVGSPHFVSLSGFLTR